MGKHRKISDLRILKCFTVWLLKILKVGLKYIKFNKFLLIFCLLSFSSKNQKYDRNKCLLMILYTFPLSLQWNSNLLASVFRYAISDSICEHYDVELTSRHIPLNTNTSSVSLLPTSVLSVCPRQEANLTPATNKFFTNQKVCINITVLKTTFVKNIS